MNTLGWMLTLLVAVRDDQDPDRPRLSVSDFKALEANNIFSPLKPARRPPPPPPPPGPGQPPAEARPAPPVVTGFVFDEKAGIHKAVVEDRNSDPKLKHFEGPKFLGEGDEVVGYRVESVTASGAVVKKGEETRELRVGDAFPGEGRSSAAGPAAASAEAPEGDAASRKKLLEGGKERLKKRRSERERQP